MRFKQYYIKESRALKQHIESMLMLLQMQKEKIDPKQVAYWEWQAKQAKSVKCKSYKSDPKLKALIDETFQIKRPEIKECYRNSWWVAATNSKDIEVVVGYASAAGIVPIEHAWSYYKPKRIYFDLTFEICLKKKVEKEEYLQIVKVKAADATKILQSTRFEITGFMGSWYFDKVMKK